VLHRRLGRDVVNAAKLIDHIFGKSLSCAAFSRALTETPRFGQFVEKHCDKIRKKIRRTRGDTDAVKDVLAELWVAYCLLHVDRFSDVQYEAYGDSVAGPDLTVTCCGCSGLVFNVEVKRILRTEVERRFLAWLRQLKDSIRKTPSGLAVSVHIGNKDYFDDETGLLDRLEARSEEVTGYIRRAIAASDSEMAPGSKKDLFVPGFEGAFELELRKPQRASSSGYTAYYRGSFPLFVTHKEFRKFGDEICDPAHLGQMRPDMINVLAIATDSGTHDELDLDQALASLKQRAAEEDNEFFIKKGFKGAGDFITLFERLSGIVLAGAFFPVRSGPKTLWRNSRAERQVPTGICDQVQAMVCQVPISFESFIHDADRLATKSGGSAKA